MARAFSWSRLAEAVLLSAGAALLLAACDSSGGTVSLPPISTVAPGPGGPTSLTVSGAVTGTLASPGASCFAAGAAGVVVTIQGTVGAGSYYVLTFDAPTGTTDLATATSPRIVVEFAPLQGIGNWGANPSRQLGSGTIVVNATGGTLDVHLVAGPGSATPASASPGSASPGSASPASVDISGSYACSSSA